MYTKPLPVVTAENQPFWDACKRHELRLQRCEDCGKVRYPIFKTCDNCLSGHFVWEKVSGSGKVFSWVVFHRPYYPSFAEDVPYNVAMVELEEGPRLLANLVGVKNEDIYIGMPVEAVFEDVTEEVTIFKFRPG